MNPSFKVVDAVEALLRGKASEYPRTMPDLSGGGRLLAASDYSGSQRQYDVMGVFVTSQKAWESWESRRLDVRSKYSLETRRMSYTKLNDAVKSRALAPFLAASSATEGVLLCIAINKAIPSFINADGTSYAREASVVEWSRWKPTVLERMLRAVSFVALLLAGLAEQSQEAAWVTDEDEIASNPDQMVRIGEIFGKMASSCSGGRIAKVHITTTAFDSGRCELEDLASIPDLAVGALADALSSIHHSGHIAYESTRWLPEGLPEKTMHIGKWLGRKDEPLRRHIFVIEKGRNEGDVDVAPIMFF